ncbi:DNA-processing protein DprA [Pleomorphovibrio marinus]|uniref:DNA-processing protein DprA n=1 Tax=Pleomorphovibrio marinus TaxID=2164132 RepID=UPI000E0B6C7D|nr:DNA-processing protein DprA [Pleomorphovibrio marinus]
MTKPFQDDLLYNVALSLIPKIGPGIFKNIISYSGSAKQFFEMSKGKAGKIPGIGPKLLSYHAAKQVYLKQAASLLEEAIKLGTQVVSFWDDAFPQRLKGLPDAPVILFTKGNVNLNPHRSIGIVGTRNATAYGRAVTSKIVEDLIPYQPTVVSGLAYGVDIEAHRAALNFGLPTLAVLGTPIDKIYPSLHKPIANQMLNDGGLVSEYRSDAPLNPSNFPQRNRIIAGMSDALIVVEAAKKGGALITAEIAYSYNREVFAVPGNLQSIYSEGCNNLIRSMKASIYMGPKELEESLSWHGKGNSQEATSPAKFDLDSLEHSERGIVQVLLDHGAMEIDRLSWETSLPISALAARLLNLEFQGIIKSLPGKKYTMLD